LVTINVSNQESSGESLFVSLKYNVNIKVDNYSKNSLNYKILIINSKSKNSEESDEEVIKNLIGKLEGKLHLQKKNK